MKQRKWLIAVLASILSCALVYDVWAASRYLVPAHVDAASAQAAGPQGQVTVLQPKPALPSPTLPTGTRTTLVLAGTPQPASTPARPAPGSTLTYEVEPGDTLFSIALYFGVSLQTLIEFNDITTPDSIRPGQKIIIPGEGVAVPARPINTPIPPAPGKVNGVPVEQFVVIPSDVEQNMRKIYGQGQALGNNPRAFSKIGDSNMEPPYFLAQFDEQDYYLGSYAYLQSVIDYFSGSFGRQSVAVRKGFHSWSVLDATLNDENWCWPQETPLDCELRLQRPSFALVRLGTNDAGCAECLHQSLEGIVQLCIRRGVIPILGTKADRTEGPDDTNNQVIRHVAADYHIPLWDFDLVARTMPDSGLGTDHVHLTIFYPLDYAMPESFQYGHSTDNLAALMALGRVWQVIAQTK